MDDRIRQVLRSPPGSQPWYERYIRVFCREIFLDKASDPTERGFWLCKILKPWPLVFQARLIYILYGPVNDENGKYLSNCLNIQWWRSKNLWLKIGSLGPTYCSVAYDFTKRMKFSYDNHTLSYLVLTCGLIICRNCRLECVTKLSNLFWRWRRRTNGPCRRPQDLTCVLWQQGLERRWFYQRVRGINRYLLLTVQYMSVSEWNLKHML